MAFDLTLILILAATVLTGLLAGASLDKAIVQLPARHRLGVVGFASFSRANDLGNGLIVYPVMGIAAALLTIIAALIVFLQRTPLTGAWPIYVAALFAILHSFVTTRAAPNMLSLRQSNDDEAALTEIFNRFAAWHNVRAILQVLNFVFLVVGIVAYISVRPS
ncbi:MAG TPA: hypothetical protein VMP08_14405 [Anaerolineae bacterium]|nr:hypothetical protein [Anaerolineae bacterium]